MLKRLRGFTLIELLVVIAIIGVLASIVLASLDGARKKGRDARRISDIKQIQLALELYYDANNQFPVGNSSNALTAAQLETPGYINKIPVDPLSNATYKYTPYMSSTDSGASATCNNYHIGATLESANHASLQQDNDIPTGTPPAGFAVCTRSGSPANDFHGLTYNGPSTVCSGPFGNASPSATNVETCYDLKP